MRRASFPASHERMFAERHVRDLAGHIESFLADVENAVGRQRDELAGGRELGWVAL